MGHSFPDERGATRYETLAEIGGKPIKADLRSQGGACQMRDVAADAIRHISSQKAAALDMKLSESRLSHKLKDGSVTIKELETLGPSYAAEFGSGLVKKYAGDVEDARTRALRLIPELLREFLAVVA